MAAKWDDSDMRIAGEEPSAELSSSLEHEKLQQQIEEKKQKGHLSKAHVLGVELARTLIDMDDIPLPAQDEIESDTVNLYRKLLFAFAVSVSIEQFLDTLVGHTALNVFYNSLKHMDSEFYDDLNTSGAFSFFYLAYRRGGEVELAVGRTFAMLCGNDGDAVLAELGEAYYAKYINTVKRKIEEYQLNET